MRLFSLGFSITLAFLIIIAVVALHMAYFPAPEGPERPEYPENPYSPFSMIQTMPQESRVLPFIPSDQSSGVTTMPVQPSTAFPSTSSAMPVSDLSIQQTFPGGDYRSEYEQYQEEMKQYEEDSKEFMKEEMIPYIKDMIIRHLVVLAVLEILAIVFVRFISVAVGGAYAFGGLLGVLFGAFGGIFIIPYTILSSFASSMTNTDQSEIFDVASFFSGIGWTAVGAVVLLTLMAILLVDGMLKFNTRSSSNLPPEAR